MSGTVPPAVPGAWRRRPPTWSITSSPGCQCCPRVLSFPIPLRFLFAAHPELLTLVLQIVHRVISGFLIKQAGLKRTQAATGAVTLRKPIGSAANLNIHLHCLVLDGVYSAHRGRTGVPRRARPHRRRAAGLTQPDHKTHRAVIDP